MLPFHPAVSSWFTETFQAPTQCQRLAWQALKSAKHVLISAPTGSGKTLAAFLAAIDDLVRQAERGVLKEATQVVYISPLRALSHDVERNLLEPLAAIQRKLTPCPPIRVQSRTGDTSKASREAMARRPPHILVTTPESLYLLLTSDSGRRALSSCRTVIVDEVHALIGEKRGAHLALSLERLERLCVHAPLRVGLSATVRPLEMVARFLLGAHSLERCTLIDIGHLRQLDLDIELPDLPLEAVLSQEAAKSLYDRMAALISAHRTTLVFVNTRRLAERVARALSERLGEAQVTSHHGSLSRAKRLEAERRLKAGEIKALVTTSSLELGIDVGEVDLVCQLGMTDSVTTLLQRVGRAGHSLAKTPKGRLFPTTRDELIAALAAIYAISRRELEACAIYPKPLDVLAQQIVAMAACEDWNEEELFATVTRATPYHELTRAEFDQVIAMLAEGYATSRGGRSAYLHRDRILKRLRGKPIAKLTALTCGGAIPDTANYRVVLEPSGEVIGTVDEDFAIESLAGDIFQLGNTSWRVLRLEADSLRVEDAQGAPPTIPFWFGEAPGRSLVLAQAVSRLREEIYRRGQEEGTEATREALQHALKVNPEAIRQAVEYLAAAGAALGLMPTQERIVLERFFDEVGDLHLIIHSPYGSRLNRAFGLALRKRFCRSFNFELQAAATEEALLLSLSATQSFPLPRVKDFLKSSTCRAILTQAVLDSPMFTARWRWNATVSLAVRRFQRGQRTPPYLVRMQAEDLLVSVFPQARACLENIQGDREIPDHPLVKQTLVDCLQHAMDVEGLEQLLTGIEKGKIEVVAKETIEPSPLAAEILAARVYAFLDGAPLEERRVRAVTQRRWIQAERSELARIDPKALAQVLEEIQLKPRDVEELHAALLSCGYLTLAEVAPFQRFVEDLATQGRACWLNGLWIAAEHLPRWQVIYPNASPTPRLTLPPDLAAETWEFEEALAAVLRARLDVTGPVSCERLSRELGLATSVIEQALLGLEQEGYVLQTELGWCERRILARLHRLTLKALRQAVQPVASKQFVQFLLAWQHVHPEYKLHGQEGLAEVLGQLEGFEAPAGFWESAILPARVTDYEPNLLDQLCLSGRFVWARLSPSGRRTPVKLSPIALIHRRHLGFWLKESQLEPSSPAGQVLDALTQQGALFFDELLEQCRILPSQLENAICELIALGRISCDSFAALRALLLPEAHKHRLKQPLQALLNTGRWYRLRLAEADPETCVEHQARRLLKRYGVVFRALVARDPALPSWLELVRIYRRLEARGEIQGGRFLAGQFGEQFALPEALTMLRQSKQACPVTLAAVDPLNLSAILPGMAPIPSQMGRAIHIQDGNITELSLKIPLFFSFKKALE